MGIDPGFRTGCKVVCLDAQGSLLHYEAIYPHPPKSDYSGAARKISQLLEAYHIEAIAIGGGTASRETEAFIRSLRFKAPAPTESSGAVPDALRVFVVSEDGASVYSASQAARDEFPDYDVTVRGAVSIGRRLMDPLSELVKIDPKSIGVGQYQHDVNQADLKKSLDYTVESCVNSVGVNLNTASDHLLTYISGLGPQLARNIVDYRTANGPFRTRRDLLKVPRMGAKAFEQSAGFLRITGGSQPLDATAVHPESYHIVEHMADDFRCGVADLIGDAALRRRIQPERYVGGTVGLPTLTDIMQELEKPGRDPRQVLRDFEFDPSVHTLADLRVGQVLPGLVTNITNFGCFVDIGIHEKGLVHISQLSDHYVKDPTTAVTLGQAVRVKVLDVDAARGRISLSMKQAQ
jgi:uncharacterized protein